MRLVDNNALPLDQVSLKELFFSVVDILKRNKLVMLRGMVSWVRKFIYMEVEGARPRGRPRKTWLEVVRNDMMELGLNGLIILCVLMICFIRLSKSRRMLNTTSIQIESQISRITSLFMTT